MILDRLKQQLQARQAAGPGFNPIEQRAGQWLSPWAAAGRPVEQQAVDRIAAISRNPYRLPFDSRESGLRSIGAGVNRARLGGAGGNAALAGGKGAAILGRNYAETEQKLGDETLARILLPYLGMQNRAYGAGTQAFLNQPKKKKKKSALGGLLSTGVDLAANYYTGGGWGQATGGGLSGR